MKLPKIPWNVFSKLTKIVPFVLQFIEVVEHQKLSGADKKTMVINLTKDALPLVEGAYGKDLVDDQLFNEALDEMNDAYVAFMNARSKLEAVIYDVRTGRAVGTGGSDNAGSSVAS